MIRVLNGRSVFVPDDEVAAFDKAHPREVEPEKPTGGRGRPRKPAEIREELKEKLRKATAENIERNKEFRARHNAEKAGVLSVLFMFGGDAVRTARATGVPLHKVSVYKKGFYDKALDSVPAETPDDLLMNYIGALGAVGLMKAHRTGSLADMHAGMESTINRLVELRKSGPPSKDSKRQPVLPEPVQAAPVVDPDAVKRDWERLVDGMVEESVRDGNPADRNEVIRTLCAQKPEARPYLMPPREPTIDDIDDNAEAS